MADENLRSEAIVKLSNKPRKIEIKSRIGIGDLKTKANTIRRILFKGFQVRVSVKFRGRESTHPEVGMEKLKLLYDMVQSDGKLSVNPTSKGNEIFFVIQPNNKKE